MRLDCYVDDIEPTALPPWRHSPLAALAALWTTLLFLVSLIEYPIYLHHPAVPIWKPLTLAAVPTSCSLLWLFVELRSARYLELPLEPAWPWFRRQLRRLPLLITCYVMIVIGVHRGLFLSGGDPDRLAEPIRVPVETLKSALFYCLWLGLVYGALSLLSMRENAAQLHRIQQALVESQLAQLQSQLRPHFLFNTLNTVSSLMHSDVRRADRILTQLGDLLRTSLVAEKTNMVPLRQELDLLRMYANIMVERFSDRVALEWQIAEGALGVAVPAMLLQPLLENAFKYGIERTTGHQVIRVAASCRDSRLRVDIFNTGSVLDCAWAAGIGITNCRERLLILYGRAATLTLSNSPPSAAMAGGVAISISLPIPQGGG